MSGGGKHMYVDERDSLFREEIIRFLEEKGYVISKTESRSRQEIIDYYLPIEVDHDNETYSMMGNVTAAAAARQKGVLSTGEDIYSFFDIPVKKIDTYKRKIRKELMHTTWKYDKEMAETIIAENEKFIEKAFKDGLTAEDVAIDIGYGCG